MGAAYRKVGKTSRSENPAMKVKPKTPMPGVFNCSRPLTSAGVKYVNGKRVTDMGLDRRAA